MAEEELKSWLASKWLISTYDLLISNGWDNLDKLSKCDDNDITNILNLYIKPGHKLKMRVMLNKLRLQYNINNEMNSNNNINVNISNANQKRKSSISLFGTTKSPIVIDSNNNYNPEKSDEEYETDDDIPPPPPDFDDNIVSHLVPPPVPLPPTVIPNMNRLSISERRDDDQDYVDDDEAFLDEDIIPAIPVPTMPPPPLPGLYSPPVPPPVPVPLPPSLTQDVIISSLSYENTEELEVVEEVIVTDQRIITPRSHVSTKGVCLPPPKLSPSSSPPPASVPPSASPPPTITPSTLTPRDLPSPSKPLSFAPPPKLNNSISPTPPSKSLPTLPPPVLTQPVISSTISPPTLPPPVIPSTITSTKSEVSSLVSSPVSSPRHEVSTVSPTSSNSLPINIECKECSCNTFTPHLFRKKECNICYHQHGPDSILDSASELVHAAKNASNEVVKFPCLECSCADFKPHLFKKGECNICYHHHGPDSKKFAVRHSVTRSGDIEQFRNNTRQGSLSSSATNSNLELFNVTCKECGCDSFQSHSFKKSECNNCYHQHPPAAIPLLSTLPAKIIEQESISPSASYLEAQRPSALEIPKRGSFFQRRGSENIGILSNMYFIFLFYSNYL